MQVSNGYLIDEYLDLVGPELILENEEPYSCMLNQTNIKNNNNKFYKMQLVKHSSNYHLFVRYGRIGNKGNESLQFFDNLPDAIYEFKKIFKSKTKNDWDSRKLFVEKPGSYFLSNLGEKVEIPKDSLTFKPFDVNPEVRKFLELISDTNMLKKAMISMDIDIEKMPLGKINLDIIKLAKNLLLDMKSKLGSLSSESLEEYSSRYYTYIPYSCGRNKPPIIDSVANIDKNISKIEDLENISVNVNVLNSAGDTNPLETVYKTMNTQMKPLDPSSKMYSIISKYITNSHGKTHGFKLNLLNIIEISRPNEEYLKKYKDTPNKQLLIHGSRLCNWVSILKNGLLLDPSKVGAVITGKMFGYGIYWANSFSKSAQYCRMSYSKEIICLTLAEVALGKELELKSSVSDMTFSKLKSKGPYDSVYALGRNTPSDFDTDSELVIPNGRLGVRDSPDCTLIYDEKIVYDPHQFDMKYMVIAEIS